MSLKAAKKLYLSIHKTIQKAVQIGGKSPLQILEVHTKFPRVNITQNFSGLVINAIAAHTL